MKLALKGYYGYKNFGDELLLLGVLSYCVQESSNITHISIEAHDVAWLDMRIQKNRETLELLGVHKNVVIEIVRRISMLSSSDTLLIVGGGEALTDARAFPYNGWSTFVYCLRYICFHRFWILGGVGTINCLGTKFLYSLFLGKAERVVCREIGSYEVVSNYSSHALLYRDFAYTALEVISVSKIKETLRPYIIVNLNHHIYTPTIVKKLLDQISPYIETHDIWFFPASVGKDDSDERLYYDLKKEIPTIQLYTWTNHSLQDIVDFVAHASYGIAARLHILLLLEHYSVPFDYIVYQEKIQKFLDGKGGKNNTQ